MNILWKQACAPRYVKLGINDENGIRQKNLQGMCYIFDTRVKKEEWRPCEEGQLKI